MDLKQLKYYCTLVEEKNFNKAAAKLFVSQPALSQQIASLENELKTTLIVREGRKSFPTDVGLLLYHHAKTILELSDNIKKEVYNYSTNIVGSLRIATSVPYTLFLDDFVRFYKKHPGIYLDFRSGTHDTVLEYLNSGVSELVITDFERFDSQKLRRFPLDTQSFTLAGNSSFLPGDRDAISVKELKDMPLIISSHADYQMLQELTIKEDFEPKVVAYADSTDTKVRLAKAGIGVCLGSETTANMAKSEGLNTVSIDGLDEPILRCVFWKDDYSLSIAASEFLAMLTGLKLWEKDKN